MQKRLVLTLSGRDRVGIVERVSKEVLKFNGNVEASRMSRLGGEFAMLMLISISLPNFENLKNGIEELKAEGFTITTCPTEATETGKYNGWLPYQVEVRGADHEGIIYRITQHLAKYNINIETMDTNMVKAPMSGTPLFMITATLLVAPDLAYAALRKDLDSIGNDLNVEIELSPYTG
jgi:glycine cleavage system transcriptional repressor